MGLTTTDPWTARCRPAARLGCADVRFRPDSVSSRPEFCAGGHQRARAAPYSILNRGVEREILPAAQHFGLCILVWGPLGQGLLTGRVRRDQDNDLRRAGIFRHLTDERRLDVVERLVPLAEEAGLPMTHLAMAFTTADPGVTSALLGARTMDQLNGLLDGLDVSLTDDILDRIDEIVPPGTDVGTLDQAYQPPALENPALRRRRQRSS